MARNAVLAPHIRSKGDASAWHDYVMLIKPRVLFMVIVTSAIGFYLALTPRANSFLLFVNTILATICVGGGAMALNQYLEREEDAKMQRTCARPIPAGRMRPEQALFFGILLSVLGFLIFSVYVNLTSMLFALATSVIYLFAYTPLKKKTSLATFVGAVSGALPPLIGWSAAGGVVNHQALSLFSILFFWQLPHFLAIDWMYRSDYARAGFKTLAVLDPSGKMVLRQMVVNTSALLTVSLLPALFRISSEVYFVAAFILGVCFSSVVIYAFSDLNERARFVLRASVAYLPLLLIFMLVDKG